MANLIGQKLGNYEIIGFLGEGGMASVYRAHQLAVKRDVAIKVIKAGMGDLTQFMQRFAREAQTVAALNHPHILKVFDYGQEGDLAYLVMELQPGGSLAGLIEAGRIPTARIATILEQVASALDYAHRQGIVHRDLKPQNILLDPDGNAILTDFGIAKLLNANASALTQSGAAIGTPTYMAPEQWQGLPVDGRTDVYALGVVLFQMLSGQLPFQGDTPFSVMHKHIYDMPPSVVSDRPQLPEAVDLVVRTAMAKDPDNRFKTAGDMATAFRAAMVGQAPTKTVPTTAPPTMGIPAPTTIGTQPPNQGDLPGKTQLLNSAAPRGNNSTMLIAVGVVVAAIIVIGGGAVVLGSRGTTTPTASATVTLAPTVAAVAIVPSATPTVVPPSATTVVTTTTVPTVVNTTDPRETQIVQTQIALQTNAALIVNAQAQLTAAAAQAIIQAATVNAVTQIVATTVLPPTVLPTVAPTTAVPTVISTTVVPTVAPTTTVPTTIAPTTAVPTVAPSAVPVTLAPTSVPPTALIVQSNGSVTFANQASGAFLDSLTMNLINLPLPGEGKQYIAWLSDRVHAPLRLGKLLVRADGTAQLTYADPKGANLVATYTVAYITNQSSATPTAQDPVVFSGAIPPLANVHVQHVLTHFPGTPGNIGLMMGALEQANVLTEHANLLAEAIKQGNVALAKLHMEHIYNILTGTDGAKDINADGVLTISPPGDGYGLLNYLTNAVEHATLTAEQPDATNDMKLAAKRLGTAIANITTNYTQIQGLIVQAAAKKVMIEIKPLMAQLVVLNNVAMNGTIVAGAAAPNPNSPQFDGLLNAYTQAAILGTITLFPGDAALKAVASPDAATTSSPGGTAAPTVITQLPPTNTSTVIPADTVVIQLQAQTFIPSSLTVKAGTKIVFSNQSSEQHTATADNGAFATGVIQPGTESKPIILSKPGTYAYFCEFHGGAGHVGMSGVIIVQ